MGDKVKCCSEVQRYTIQARDNRFVVMTKPFNAQRTYLYSIVDLERGVRGPCNLIFGLPGDDVDNEEGAQDLLARLQTGEVEVSYRRHMELTQPEKDQLTCTGSS